MSSKIRVLFPRNPPDVFDNCRTFPTYSPTVDCLFPGWTLEILMTIAQALQLEVEPVFMDGHPGEVNWGTLVNGTWFGALSYLQTDQVDVIALFFQQTNARMAYFDYSYPVTTVQEVLTAREVDYAAEVSIWDALKPYDNAVWAIFLASIVLQTIVLCFVKGVENKLENLVVNGSWEMVWNVIAYQLMQFQESFNFFTNTGRFLLTLFGVCHLILFLGLYQSYLISALLQNTASTPFKDKKEMVKAVAEGRYALIRINNGNWIYDEVDNSYFFEDLRAALAKTPYVLRNNSLEGIASIENEGKYLMFNQIDSYATLFVNQKCNLLTISDGMPQKTAHFLFQRGSPYVDKFNKQIIMQQSFILRTYTKYFDAGFKLYKPSNCTRTSARGGDYRPLGLTDCIGLFVVLLIGWAAAPFAILVEILVFYGIKYIKNKRA